MSICETWLNDTVILFGLITGNMIDSISSSGMHKGKTSHKNGNILCLVFHLCVKIQQHRLVQVPGGHYLEGTLFLFLDSC